MSPMADTIHVTVGQLLAVAEKPPNLVSDGLRSPILKFSISPEFLAALAAEKNRLAGRGVLVPTDGLSTRTGGADGNARHDLLS